ncbi:DNA ligase 4-like [Anopheles darlingi]|uniref:DNA ligase 4-like n=1 Tax=Anopheles darlingi TaxID=43151 RepID=UPI0021003F67|nr:DNA ligase 4-like [Anopheles darlingi]
MAARNESTLTAFSELVAVLTRAETAKNKQEVWRNFFTTYECSKRNVPSATIYPTLRLLVPGMDSERKSYGLRHKLLTDGYIRALGLNSRSDEVRQLSAPETKGDLGVRLERLVRGRCPDRSSLTIADANRLLDELGLAGTGQRRRVEQVLAELLECGSPADHRWLVRIILKDLRLGISQRSILQLYHPHAPQLYDTTGDLRQLVQEIESGRVTKASGPPIPGGYIRLMHHVRPMLCQRIDLRAVGALLQQGTYWAETKMDGERFQLHKSGPHYRYLSRNGIDYSERFGATADQLDGTLTPLVAELFAPSLESVILDGEMMVYDRRDLRYRDKCENTDVKALRAGATDLRPCFCVYDVLYHNGRPLTGVPYAERLRLLTTLLVREQPGFIVYCQREQVRDAAHLVQLLNTAIDGEQEGLVLKREDAIYQPNRRHGGGWYKLKPDYVGGLVVDFDLLILGGYYNRRRTFVNTFLVGVRDDSSSDYLTLAKVSMGLQAEQWAELNRTLAPHWQEVVAGQSNGADPSSPQYPRWGQTVPDVWLEPKESIVLQLRGSELVRSESYAAGHTLRFPRILAIRTDRRYNDVCTIEELLALVAVGPGGGTGDPRNVTKLAKRHVTIDDLTGGQGTTKGPSKRARGAGRPLTIAAPNHRQPAEVLQTIDNACGGREFCVMSTHVVQPTVAELERMIRQHGGRVVANPGSNTYAIVAGARTFKVDRYCRAARWDVVRVEWLMRAMGAGKEPSARQPGQVEPFRPADLHAATEATQRWLAEHYDRFGDSYTRPVSPGTFKGLLQQPDAALSQLSEQEMQRAERTLLRLPATLSGRRPFRGYSARLFLEQQQQQQADVPLARYRAERHMLRFVRHGGRWLPDTEPGPVSYVFVVQEGEIDDQPAGLTHWLETVSGRNQNQNWPPPTIHPIEFIAKSLADGQLLTSRSQSPSVVKPSRSSPSVFTPQ